MLDTFTGRVALQAQKRMCAYDAGSILTSQEYESRLRILLGQGEGRKQRCFWKLNVNGRGSCRRVHQIQVQHRRSRGIGEADRAMQCMGARPTTAGGRREKPGEAGDRPGRPRWDRQSTSAELRSSQCPRPLPHCAPPPAPTISPSNFTVY